MFLFKTMCNKEAGIKKIYIVLSWLGHKEDVQYIVCSKQRTLPVRWCKKQANQCNIYSQCRFVYQTTVFAVKTVGLPQHLEERRPILRTNTPQRTAPRRLKQMQMNPVIELFQLNVSVKCGRFDLTWSLTLWMRQKLLLSDRLCRTEFLHPPVAVL